MNDNKVMSNPRAVNAALAHEDMCLRAGGASAFMIDQILELATGIYAVLDTEGEYTIYWDKTDERIAGVASDSPFVDLSGQIPGFPANTGFVEDVTAKSWKDITRTASMTLIGNGSAIVWYVLMIPLNMAEARAIFEGSRQQQQE